MSDIFIYRFEKPESKKNQSMAVFFFSSINNNLLIKKIKEDVSLNLVPNDVVIFGFGVDKIQADKLLSDDIFLNEFDSYIGNPNEKISFFNIDESGCFKNVFNGAGIGFKESLLQAGSNEIFKSRKGVISSSMNYHFIKPSGDHCDKFIRASNLFTSGVEVTFLAIGLLEHIKPDLTRVYVDTSSISFLVSTALHLSKKYNDAMPVIESFESYTALEQPFDFINSNSMVFISATTSGSLASHLEKSKKINVNSIVTLFYSALSIGQKGIYDILEAVGGDIYSEAEDKCQLCALGSRVIKIEGEQFIPETPKHEILVIKKSDFNKSRQDFFRELAAKDVLKLNVMINGTQDDFFDVDIVKMLNSEFPSFSALMQRKLNKHFSRDTKRIINLDDEGSFSLALKIKGLISDDSVELVKFSDVEEKDFDGSSSVLVVAGAITSGRKLLSVSRKLRGIKKSASICYFVGISKLPSKKDLEQLKSDLCMGGHELITLRDCYLPRINEKSKTLWDLEKEKLSKFDEISDPFSSYGAQAKLPKNLNKRLKLLNENLKNGQVFLNTVKDKPLKLRGTFVFWSELDIKYKKSSQADVFWTIQTLLHDLRMQNGKGLSTTYHYTLISPVCFDRFNDGVIQACLLRAAKPSELNYMVDEVFSRQMADIIHSVVRNWDNEQGEGCLEFLFAIWTQHLRLLDKHLLDVINLSDDSMPEVIQFLLGEIKREILKY